MQNNAEQTKQIEQYNKDNDFKGHSLFNDVQDEALRTFNRTQVFYNIYHHLGRANSEDYVSCFTGHDRALIFVTLLKLKGLFGDKRTTSDDWEQARIQIQKEYSI